MTLLALGNFDGLHLGHQELIKETKKLSQELACKSGLLTFHPHPNKILRKNLPFQELITLDKKKTLVEASGLENFFVMDFSEELSRKEPEVFIKDLINCYHITGLITGIDFRFGYQRKGSAELLCHLARKGLFIYKAIRKLQVNFCPLSSSHLRELVKTGAMKLFKKFTGRYYSIAVTLNGQLGSISETDILLPPPGAFLAKKGGDFVIMVFLSRLEFHLEPLFAPLTGVWQGEIELIEILGEGIDKGNCSQLIIERLIKNAQFALKKYGF